MGDSNKPAAPSHAAPDVCRELCTAPTKLCHLSPLKALLKLPFAIRRLQKLSRVTHWCDGTGASLAKGHVDTVCFSTSSIPLCQAVVFCLFDSKSWNANSELCPQSISQHRQVIRSKSWLRRSRTGRFTTKKVHSTKTSQTSPSQN